MKQLLVLRSSGHVEGKWVYGEIEVEKGGVLSGTAESTGFRGAERKPAKDEAAHPTRFRKPELVSSTPAPEANEPLVLTGSNLAVRALRERKKQS